MKVRNRKIGSKSKPTPKYVIKNCRWSVVVFCTWRFGTPKKRPFYHTQNLIGISDPLKFDRTFGLKNGVKPHRNSEKCTQKWFRLPCSPFRSKVRGFLKWLKIPLKIPQKHPKMLFNPLTRLFREIG